MNAPEACLDEASRAVLRNLAKALLPLDEWIRSREQNGYKPPNAEMLPWRKEGASLSTDQLGLIEFVEALLRESANDVFLLARWRTLQAQPLKYCPIDNKDEWRGARGLDSVPRFGAVESENAPADDSGNQIARSQLYADYLPLLATAAVARRPSDDVGWKAFALELFKDSCPQWPASQSYRSSKFMLQLLRDLLYATLGVRNPVPEPWRSAVLTEIGEFRRPGNVYTREGIEHGLREFIDVLSTYPILQVQETMYADSVKVHYLEFSNRRL